MDPEGKVSKQRRHEVQSNFEKLAQSLLDGEGIPADNWTTSLQDQQQQARHRGVCILKNPKKLRHRENQ